MDIDAILSAASQDVEKAGVPDDLRAIAFAKAVDLRAAQGIAPNDPQAPQPPMGVSDLAGRVAARLRVDASAVAEVIEVTQDSVDVIVAPSRLPRQKAAATRDVALIVTSARQAAGIDDGWTSAEVVREQCRNLGVFDSPNFATELGRMSDVFGFKGSGRSRQIRVNMRGYEQAGLRIAELAGGS
jgi:hypothetical protein